MSDNNFKLKDYFVRKYKGRKVPFGFNGLGELVYMRTYSRIKENGENEKWYETIRRVVEGTYSIQKRHILKHGLGWDEEKAHKSAQEMYDLMFNMKFLPPGRGLWAMGTNIIEERGLFVALNNCSFVSTKDLDKEPTKPFEFLMDVSMLGVGVGFDVEGAGKLTIHQPFEKVSEAVQIEDTREGWVNSVKQLLLSYFQPSKYSIAFDYNLIRVEGTPIKTFGGKASGPGPLVYLHEQIRNVFNGRHGELLTIRDIVDVMNMIGCCVVAGNVRRSAEIAIGPHNSEEFSSLKDYRWDGEKYVGSKVDRASYGWASNNSIFAELGMDYTKHGDQTGRNGEPGYAWLSNMQKYSRMNGVVDNKDRRAAGSNPCVEQTLESYELCCLVETFPSRCSSFEEFQRTLKYAYLYAKTVTLGNTHWEESNRVMLRNRRIGTSQSGIVQAIHNLGIHEYKKWCKEGYNTIQYYDAVYSDWLCVPRSIKTTSIKPSGTISLLPGVTPGMHYPENNFYIRRVRMAKNSELIQKCIDAGYGIEESVSDNNSMVIEIPVALEGIRTVDQVSMWEQLCLAAFLQRYWADNQVSCTVTFKPQDADQIKFALNYFQYQLKGISFLPKLESGTTYAQMPYESISKEKYEELISKVIPINFEGVSEDSTPEKFCDSEKCEIS